MEVVRHLCIYCYEVRNDRGPAFTSSGRFGLFKNLRIHVGDLKEKI
jgi:hypothetical protein